MIESGPRAAAKNTVSFEVGDVGRPAADAVRLYSCVVAKQRQSIRQPGCAGHHLWTIL